MLYFPCNFMLKSIFLLPKLWVKILLSWLHICLGAEEWIISQSPFYLLGEKPFPSLMCEGERNRIYWDLTTWGMGKCPSPGKSMSISKQMFRELPHLARPSFLLSLSPYYLPCVAVHAPFLVLPLGWGK